MYWSPLRTRWPLACYAESACNGQPGWPSLAPSQLQPRLLGLLVRLIGATVLTASFLNLSVHTTLQNRSNFQHGHGCVASKCSRSIVTSIEERCITTTLSLRL